MIKMRIITSEKISQVRHDAYNHLSMLTTLPSLLLDDLDQESLTGDDRKEFFDSLGDIESSILKIMGELQDLGSLYSPEMHSLLRKSYQSNESLKAATNPDVGLECKAPYDFIKSHLKTIYDNGLALVKDLKGL